MSSNGVFVFAAILIAALLSVAFLTPERPLNMPNAAGEYPMDGRTSDQRGVNARADADARPQADTRAEMDAIYERRASTAPASRDKRPKP